MFVANLIVICIQLYFLDRGPCTACQIDLPLCARPGSGASQPTPGTYTVRYPQTPLLQGRDHSPKTHVQCRLVCQPRDLYHSTLSNLPLTRPGSGASQPTPGTYTVRYPQAPLLQGRDHSRLTHVHCGPVYLPRDQYPPQHPTMPNLPPPHVQHELQPLAADMWINTEQLQTVTYNSHYYVSYQFIFRDYRLSTSLLCSLCENNANVLVQVKRSSLRKIFSLFPKLQDRWAKCVTQTGLEPGSPLAGSGTSALRHDPVVNIRYNEYLNISNKGTANSVPQTTSGSLLLTISPLAMFILLMMTAVCLNPENNHSDHTLQDEKEQEVPTPSNTPVDQSDPPAQTDPTPPSTEPALTPTTSLQPAHQQLVEETLEGTRHSRIKSPGPIELIDFLIARRRSSSLPPPYSTSLLPAEVEKIRDKYYYSTPTSKRSRTRSGSKIRTPRTRNDLCSRTQDRDETLESNMSIDQSIKPLEQPTTCGTFNDPEQSLQDDNPEH